MHLQDVLTSKLVISTGKTWKDRYVCYVCCLCQADRCYTSWELLLKQQKLADVAIIATPDQMHVGPAVAAAKLGYHLLLEKPMATTLEVDP